MGIQSDLFNALVDLPVMDGPAERKAFVMTAGFSSLTIYLDWQGSNAEFVARLIDELSRRGKATVTDFLRAVGGTGWVGVERVDVLAALQGQIEGLDEAAFRTEFAVKAPEAVPGAPPLPDPGVLATSLVGEILEPFYQLGPDALKAQAGAQSVQLAQQVAAALQEGLVGDPVLAKIFTSFQGQPAALAPVFVDLLKDKLAQEPALTQRLAALVAAAAEDPRQSGLGGAIEVAQKIGSVSGDVVGAAVGADVLTQLKQRLSIHQEVDTVEAGGSLVGLVLGSGDTSSSDS